MLITKKEIDTWTKIVNQTTPHSNIYGCYLILNLLYPNRNNKWDLIRLEYVQDTGHKLPYPLEGEFLSAFRNYLVAKILQKLYGLHK